MTSSPPRPRLLRPNRLHRRHQSPALPYFHPPFSLRISPYNTNPPHHPTLHPINPQGSPLKPSPLRPLPMSFPLLSQQSSPMPPYPMRPSSKLSTTSSKLGLNIWRTLRPLVAASLSDTSPCILWPISLQFTRSRWPSRSRRWWGTSHTRLRTTRTLTPKLTACQSQASRPPWWESQQPWLLTITPGWWAKRCSIRWLW